MFEVKVNLESRLMLKAACEFFAAELGISQFDYDSRLSIKKTDKLKGCGGHCEGLYMNYALKNVEIKILSYPSDIGMIEVIAHEMVHAKQHFNGEFTYMSRKKKIFWFFDIVEVVSVHSGQVICDTPYFERKCEQEAFTKSAEMTRKFLNYYYNLKNNNDKDRGLASLPEQKEEKCLH